MLRFGAFLCVFAHHSPWPSLAEYTKKGLPIGVGRWVTTLPHAGAFGVDLFFTLSAFLITALLLREYDSRGRLDVAAFYIRRALRIWPLYFVFLGLTVLAVPRILPFEHLGARGVLPYLFFVGNWPCVFNGFPESVARSLWSVSIEEQFYLLWPPVLVLLGVRRIGAVAIVMIVVSVCTRAVLSLHHVEYAGVWCNTLARLDPFACGALLAVALHSAGPPRLSSHSRIGSFLCGVSLWVLVSRFLAMNGALSNAAYPLVAIGSLLILVACLYPSDAQPRWAHCRQLIFLGRISYGLYVFHDLSNFLSAKLPLGFAPNMILSLLFTMGIASLSYYCLEAPFLRLKERFTHIASRPVGDIAPNRA